MAHGHNPERVTVVRGPKRCHYAESFAMAPNATMIAATGLSETVGPEPEMCVIDRDGRIIDKLGPGYCPVWSPDSTRLIIDWHPNLKKLFRVNSKGQIESTSTNIPGNIPMWNKTSTRILMRGHQHAESPRYLMLDKNGGQVCDPIWTASELDLVGWSPDGQRLLVFNRVTQTMTVYDDQGRQTLTQKLSCGLWCSRMFWAHDSTHVLVAPSASERHRTTILNIQDNTYAVFDFKDYESILRWSPDGSRVCIVANRYTDIRDGINLSLVATVPECIAACCTVFPHWSSDSSKLAVYRGMSIIAVYNRDGQPLSVISLLNGFQSPRLSNDFMHLLTGNKEEVRVTCLAKWSDRTNYMFSKQHRRTVFVMMMVWHALDIDSKQQTPSLGLPRVPMELWLMVLDFLQTRLCQ